MIADCYEGLGAGTAMDMRTSILVVDDDPGIGELIGDFLTSHGFVVEVAVDGPDMRAKMAQTHFDLIVLDVMMPGEDGLSILRSMEPKDMPAIILLSVMATDVDRIVGLEMGADDYVAKPCNPRELLARIRAVLRRRAAGESGAPMPAARADEPALCFDGWRLQPDARELTDPSGASVALSDGEFRLLLAFAERPRRVLSRDQLLDYARGADSDHFDRAIDVQISRLRRKLAASSEADIIRTVRNEGYLFVPAVTRG